MKQALSSVALQEIIPAILLSNELHVSAPATKRWRTVPKYTSCFDFIHTLVSSVSEGNVLNVFSTARETEETRSVVGLFLELRYGRLSYMCST